MTINLLSPANPFEKSHKWYVCLIWAALGAFCAAVLTLIFNLLHLVDDPSYQEAAEGLFSASPHLSVMVILYGLVTPVAEEILFRYLTYGFLFKKTGRQVLSVVLTAAIFGIYHLNPVQMLYGFLMGLVITYGYARERNILIPILAHSAANIVALIFTFAPFTA